MDFLSLFIISVVEGITEFLPISSTGHMIIVSDFLNLEQTEKLKSFKGMIQFFAILAILFIFKEKVDVKKIELWQKIAVAFIPIGLVGFIFSDFIKSLFDIQIVAWAFIVGGIALLFSENFFKLKEKKEVKDIEDITFLDSLKIGLFQLFSLVPGTSRSGATMFGGMFVGINRKISSEFSFLLAVPTTLAVFSFDFISFFQVFKKSDFIFLAFSGIISFLSAYLSVKIFLKFLEKFTLFAFGLYRIIFGIILLLFFI